MKVQFEDYDRISVVRLSGDFTADDVDHFRRPIGERLAGQTRDFVLEMEETGFVDSAALEALLWLQDAAAERLGQIRLVGVHENVRTILDITRLSNQFECHAQTTDAIRSLR